MANEDDLIGPAEAAAVLGVAIDQIEVLVEDDVLVPVEGTDEPRFRRAAVEAVRLEGG